MGDRAIWRSGRERWLQTREHREMADIERLEFRSEVLGSCCDHIVDDVDFGMGTAKLPKVFTAASGDSVAHRFHLEG